MKTDVPFDGIDFGELPGEINDLLQAGVLAYRTDGEAADALFREALKLDPQALPTYFCLYKIHTYRGRQGADYLVLEIGALMPSGGLSQDFARGALAGARTRHRSSAH